MFITFFHAYLYGSTFISYFLCDATFDVSAYYNSLFDVTIGGGGHFNSPFNVTIDYLTTSSFISTYVILPFGSLTVLTIYYINFPILLAYNVELYVGNLLGKSV